MEDQNAELTNQPGQNMDEPGSDFDSIASAPAYQVLDSIEATKTLQPSNVMTPFDGVPGMQMQPVSEPAQASVPAQPQQMPYAQPQVMPYAQQQQMPAAQQPQYAYAPQMMQMPAAQTFAYPAQQVPPQQMQPQYAVNGATKFCKFCAAKIPADAVICTACGRQVEMLSQQAPQQIVINNTGDNVVNAPVNVSNQTALVVGQQPKDKWVSFLLCLFLGVLGVHKFYEGKPVLGIVYLFTGGLCGIGWLVDLILILLKPNPYYV